MDIMKKFSLEGRVALVTGAAYGIGFAIAEALAGAGARIAFNCRSQENLDKALAAYREKGIEAHGYIADVTKEDEVRELVKKIQADLGGVDILVNNAGIIKRIPMLDMSAECRPDALALCYPVITAGKFAHRESIDFVTGGDPALRETLSLEKHVTKDMPPTFVWHCVGDESVPVENTLLLTLAMQNAGVPYECHLFAGGAHGVSLCNQEVETPFPDCAPWMNLCQTWLNRRFQFTP